MILDAKKVKPTPLVVVFENIPQEMKDCKAWCLWSYEYRPDQNKPWTKVPRQPYTGNRARSNDPSTWSTFDDCKWWLENRNAAGNYAGLGFFLQGDFLAIDIDALNDELRQTAIDLDTYAELSPSGNGLRCVMRGSLPKGDVYIKRGEFEMYDKSSPRFVTITGQRISLNESVRADQSAINAFHAQYLGMKVPSKPSKVTSVSVTTDFPTDDLLDMALDSDKARDLYTTGDWGKWNFPSQSEADMSLCISLATVTDDHELIDSWFRQSALYRHKWDRADYSGDTIAKAIENATEKRDDINLRMVDAANLVAGIDGAKIGTSNEEDTPDVSRRRVFSLGDRLDMVRPEWIVKQLLRRNTVAVLYGESGSRKTWLALDLALSIATGTTFLDTYPVKQGKVYYIISEGADDFEYRALAWCKTKGITLESTKDNFKYFPSSYDFTDDDAVDECIADITHNLRSTDTIFVDTLSKNFAGDADKNSEMNAFLQRIEALREATGATVVLIHHTGWSNTDRERGGRSIRDNVDTSIAVSKEGDVSEVKCSKQKTGREFEPFKVRFQHVLLDGHDYDGETASGLVGEIVSTSELNDTLEGLIRLVLSQSDDPMTQQEIIKQVQSLWQDGTPPGRDKIRAKLTELDFAIWLKESVGGKYTYRLIGG